MRKVRVQNPLVDKTYKTLISSDYISGAALTVFSNVSFAASNLTIVGEPSEELTEEKRIASISGTTTINMASGLNFSHAKGTAIYRVLWDFVVIERRASSSDSWAAITESPIQWDNKNNETIYFDSSGVETSQYRYRFYNSVTVTYSEYSPTLTGAGFSRQQVGYMLREVRKIVQDLERKIVTDDEIIRYFNRGQDIIYGNNPRYWFLLVDTYRAGTGISATASTDVYSLSTYSTFGHLQSVRYRYNSSGTDTIYHLEQKPIFEFDKLMSDLNQTADDWASSYKILPADSSSSNGYLHIFPETKTTGVGTIYPNYFEKMANLDTVDDETQVPFPNLLEDFAISQIEKVKGNEGKAKVYEDLFFGPPDKLEGRVQINGLKLLDELNEQQQNAQLQPRNLWTFRGRKAIKRYFGTPAQNRDYKAEYYME